MDEGFFRCAACDKVVKNDEGVFIPFIGAQSQPNGEDPFEVLVKVCEKHVVKDPVTIRDYFMG